MGKRKTRYHIVTKNNQVFPEPGSCVWQKAGKKIVWNINEGQPVIYKTDETGCKGIAVDCATITKGDLRDIKFGVGFSYNKNGIVDEVRHIGIGKVNWCDIDKIESSSPKCGSPEVVDSYFGCIKCNETYSVNVELIDNTTKSYTKFNKHGINFTASYTTKCLTCDDCPTDPPSCDEVVCGLVDGLNGEIADQLKNYPDYKHYDAERQFRVVKLHNQENSSLVYCLKPTTKDACDCKKCNAFDLISDFSIDGVTHEFVGNVDPSSSTHTMRVQLQCIVDQINEQFEKVGRHSGHAYLTGGAENIIDCCPVQIHVNTCRDFVFGDLEPTDSYNPFERNGCIVQPSTCQSCDSADTALKMTCGFRVITAPIKGECGCYIEKPLSYYARRANVWFVGDNWFRPHTKVIKVQKAEQPRNFGAWIQFQELFQPPGGKGRKYKRGATRRGWLGLPSKDSRIVQASRAECGRDYCSIHIDWSEWRKEGAVQRCTEYNGNIHIPTCDADTLDALYGFANKLAEFNPECKPLHPIECKSLDCKCTTIEDSCGDIEYAEPADCPDCGK